VLIFGLWAAGCDGGGDACEPGRQLACGCAGGVEGYQLCLADGSGWGECQCCAPDCSGRACGPDPICGEDCGSCQAPETCSGAGQCFLECTEPNSMCWQLSVPATFSATPVNLYVSGFSSYPPSGAPTGVFDGVANPAIGAGQPFVFRATGYDQAGFSGDLYLSVTLLVQGGGTITPVAGVDWLGGLDTPIHFDGQAKNVPPLELELY
jgi:hypothetical protein